MSVELVDPGRDVRVGVDVGEGLSDEADGVESGCVAASIALDVDAACCGDVRGIRRVAVGAGIAGVTWCAGSGAGCAWSGSEGGSVVLTGSLTSSWLASCCTKSFLLVRS